MSQIPLHPTRTLDPHLTFCPRCGETGSALTIGHLKKGKTSEGKTVYFNRGDQSKTERKLKTSIYYVEDVDENERIPDIDICDKCKAELGLHKKIIEEGGIYFKCASCNAEGVIRKNAFADHVRKVMNIAAPKPCGIEFDTCDKHKVTADDES